MKTEMPVDNSSKYNDKALCIFPRDENKTKYLKLEFQILLDIKWGSVKMFKGTLRLHYLFPESFWIMTLSFNGECICHLILVHRWAIWDSSVLRTLICLVQSKHRVLTFHSVDCDHVSFFRVSWTTSWSTDLQIKIYND
jgi:hypothetical protein